MHKLYKGLWNLSGNISEKLGMKKFWFLLLNISLWIMFGVFVSVSVSVIPGIGFSWKNLFIITVYMGIVMGYYGSIMYMFRNTTPRDMNETGVKKD